MNWEEVNGHLDELKGKVRRQWGKLTDDDIERWRGRREELVGKLRQRYGKSKEQAEQWVDDFLAKV